jgi:methylenetetrahydrofolate--tRNA-(uracil-5-)-methyltransferase
LIGHLTNREAKNFQPMNVAFGLFPPLNLRIPKRERGLRYSQRALAALASFTAQQA